MAYFSITKTVMIYALLLLTLTAIFHTNSAVSSIINNDQQSHTKLRHLLGTDTDDVDLDALGQDLMDAAAQFGSNALARVKQLITLNVDVNYMDESGKFLSVVVHIYNYVQ